MWEAQLTRQAMDSSPTPFRVVVTGAECTGKTTLARELAARFGAAASPEYARAYLDRVARPLTADDVEPIARGQIAGEDAAIGSAAPLVVHDTDLVSTVTYARYYYGDCPAWIVHTARARRADLYLFLRDDVPWVPDGLQRDSSAARADVEARLEAALHHIGATVVAIGGGWKARRHAAIAAVDAAISSERCP